MFLNGFYSLTDGMRNVVENFCVGDPQLSAAYLLVRNCWAVFRRKTRDFGLRLAPVRRSTARNHLWSEVVGVFAKLATKMRKFAKPSWRSFGSSENHFSTSAFDKLTFQTSPAPSTDFRNTSLRAAVNLYPDSLLGSSSLRDVSAWRISFARRSTIYSRDPPLEI